MTNPVSQYTHPGQLQLGDIIIKSPNGQELDITPQVIDINIYESIFSNSLTATMVIVDSIGLISKLPIIGFEQVHFTLKTPTDELKSLEFFLYKVSPRKNINEKSATYIIQLISIEGILDQTISFSKSYSGKYSDIAFRYFRDSFPSSKKKFSIDESSNASTFINPYWNPFQTMNWLANRAIPNGKRIPSYMFYETLDGFSFKSMEFMNESPSEFEYIFRPMNVDFGGNKVLNKMKTIVDFTVNEFASSLELISNGAFASRIFIKDANQLSYTRKQFEYSSTFENYKKLNSETIKPAMDAFGNSLETPCMTKFIGTTGNAYGNVQDNNSFGAWVLERKSLLEQIMASNCEILVHGHCGLTCGDCIDLIIPEASTDSIIDRHLSGKYMITGIRHIMNRENQHMMGLEISKESFASAEHLKRLEDSTIKNEVTE